MELWLSLLKAGSVPSPAGSWLLDYGPVGVALFTGAGLLFLLVRLGVIPAASKQKTEADLELTSPCAGHSTTCYSQIAKLWEEKDKQIQVKDQQISSLQEALKASRETNAESRRLMSDLLKETIPRRGR